MKKIIAGLLMVSAIATYSSCKKQEADPGTQPLNENSSATPAAAATACGTKYLDLVVDPSSGQSLLYVVYNSPSNAPVSVVNINGSAGNNTIGSSSPGTTVTFMTGLAFDPATSTCYGITGSAGSHPHSLIKFNVGDPNVVSIFPLVSLSRFNLSDIELNPGTGKYNAINRAPTTNNRIVEVDVTTGNITSLPSGTGLTLLRGTNRNKFQKS